MRHSQIGVDMVIEPRRLDSKCLGSSSQKGLNLGSSPSPSMTGPGSGPVLPLGSSLYTDLVRYMNSSLCQFLMNLLHGRWQGSSLYGS